MEVNEAGIIFENEMNIKTVNIERCSVGIGNYVFLISTDNNKFILRCTKEKKAYNETIHWLSKLTECSIPIPKVLCYGEYNYYTYLILSYIEGDDIGNVYGDLTDNEKKQIAKDVIAIQLKVSKLTITVTSEWNWNSIIDETIERAYERISINNYFDLSKIDEIKCLQKELKDYLNSVNPIPYLDDISTKNLLIHNGKLSGVIDIDWLGIGDVLTFIAMTRVALLNMGMDTRYVEHLLDELHPNEMEYRAFVFYCLLFCVDFMGERGMNFLDKVIPVNQDIINKLNKIYNELMAQWKNVSSI